MRPAVVTALTLCALAACGDSASSPNNGPGTTIIVTTKTAPALIAFRDGLDADWQTPVAQSVGRYEIEIHGPYTVESVCTGPHYSWTVEMSRTPDDPHNLDMPCPRSASPTSKLTGIMIHGGNIALGGEYTFNYGDNWQFTLPASDGPVDLVATGSLDLDDLVAIRRDIPISGATELTTPIDLQAEGVPRVEYPVEVLHAEATDDVLLGWWLYTRSTHSWRMYSERPPRILPATTLLSTDAQYVGAQAYKQPQQGTSDFGSSARETSRKIVDGGSSVLSLPPALDEMAFSVIDNELVGSWGAVPDLDLALFDMVTLDAGAFYDDRTAVHSAYVSTRYIESAGVVSTSLHTDILGYDPAWRIDFAKESARDLMLSRFGTDGEIYTTVSQSLNVPPPDTAGRRIEDRQRNFSTARAGLHPTQRRWEP